MPGERVPEWVSTRPTAVREVGIGFGRNLRYQIDKPAAIKAASRVNEISCCLLIRATILEGVRESNHADHEDHEFMEVISKYKIVALSVRAHRELRG